MISLTGVLPIDKILPNDEERARPQRMRSIQEEEKGRGDASPQSLSHRSTKEGEGMGLAQLEPVRGAEVKDGDLKDVQ